MTVSGFRWHEPLPTSCAPTTSARPGTPIAGNLPEAPVNDLRPHPEQPGRLFAATDLGVYETGDGGATWHRAGTGLPNVVVTHLGWDALRQQVVAGTYGRSVWALDAATATAVGDEVAVGGAATLRPPFPNPASHGTTFAWDLARDGDVTVEVFTVSGRRVWRRTVDGAAKGPGEVFWNGRDLGGRPAAAGVYLARVAVEGRTVGSKTVVLTR